MSQKIPKFLTHPRWSKNKSKGDSTMISDINAAESNEYLIEKQAFDLIHPRRQFKIGYKGMIALMFTFCILSIFAMVGIHEIYINHHSRIIGSLASDQPFDCGNSSTEALAKGCTWDQLTWSWYPPNCPHYKNEDFIKYDLQNPWVYYDDPYTRHPVPDAELFKAMDENRPLWSERREHATHCIHLFLSLGQIARDGTPHVPKFTDQHHLHHCGTWLLDLLKERADWTAIQAKIPDPIFRQTCSRDPRVKEEVKY